MESNLILIILNCINTSYLLTYHMHQLQILPLVPFRLALWTRPVGQTLAEDTERQADDDHNYNTTAEYRPLHHGLHSSNKRISHGGLLLYYSGMDDAQLPENRLDDGDQLLIQGLVVYANIFLVI